jgi:type IV secretion system protein VirB5
MKRTTLAPILLSSVLALVPASSPQAALPVIDAAAIGQLVQQVRYWVQQVQLMQHQLTQLQQTHAAITGARGMQALLPETARNYLPPDWRELQQLLDQDSAGYAGLATQVQTAMSANALLAGTRLSAMSPQQRQLIDDGRAAAAMLQALSRSAYAHTSERFAALQRLIDALAGTGDIKAVMDLQARVQSEQAMLQNEQIKLTTLHQAAQAQQWVQEQRVREAAIRAIGTYGSGFHPSF